MTAKNTTPEKKGTRRFERPGDLLAGRAFFILSPAGNVLYQGFIWGRVEPGFYLVQYFEALMGQPNDLRVVPLSEIMGWRLEEDDDALRFQMEYGFIGARDRRATKAAEHAAKVAAA